MKPDLSVTVGGVRFPNPFYVASGPTTKNVRQLMRIEETGWAAASIKLSIDPEPYINRKPRYGLLRDRNALAFTAEKRLSSAEGLRLIREGKKALDHLILMANITYAGENGSKGWADLAKRFQDAGADVIELNMCCPNMSYNVELTGNIGDKPRTGASMGQHADIAGEIVSSVRSAVSIPLFVKLTPEGGQIAAVAKALYQAGADAVGSTANRLGMSAIDLDHPERSRFHLQDEISMGCHCGPWLKPLAQRDTYEIRKLNGPEVIIAATGGIASWKDAAEMILCGGTLLGVCSETLISGYDIVRPMIQGLTSYMEEHSYDDIRSFSGKIVPAVRSAQDVTLHPGHARIKEPHLSAPCKAACPNHVPIQAYVDQIAAGNFRSAYQTILESGPLQRLCMHVCSHPCEDACIHLSVGDRPVRIKELKRFVLEYGDAQGWEQAVQAAPGRPAVAVVGLGPAGMALSGILASAGYKVTAFEQSSRIGGKLRCAVGAGLLPQDALDQEEERLRRMGVAVRTGTKFDPRDVSLYDRVVYATGGAGPTDTEDRFGQDALEYLAGDTMETGTVIAYGVQRETVYAALAAQRRGAEKVILAAKSFQSPKSSQKELLDLAAKAGIVLLEGVTLVGADEGKAVFSHAAGSMTLPFHRLLSCKTRSAETQPDCWGKDIASAVMAARKTAADVDKQLRGNDATIQPPPAIRVVDRELVRRRIKYAPKSRPTAEPILSCEEAAAEASRCYRCGCGEGCQRCKTICTDFAPYISGCDQLAIDPKACVACGMCLLRCPNNNIEMVEDTGDEP